MKRKLISLVLGLTVASVTFAGCGSSGKSVSSSTVQTEATKAPDAGKKPIFGLSVMTLGAEFFTGLQKSSEKVFGDAGFDVKTASAEMDVAKQVSDIENFVTQGAKGILVGPMDPNSLQDACISARKAGTAIITFVDFKNKDAYDVLIGVDEKKLGEGSAELASEWIDKTFADAPDKSVETILITYPVNETATMRINGLKTISNNKKVKIAQEYKMGSSDTTDRVQEFTEMALSQFPNLKCILCQDSSFAIAANEVLSRNASVNKAKVGVFAIGSSNSALEAIKSSQSNKSMIRGVIDLEDVATSAMKAWTVINSKTVPESKFIAGSFSKVNAENVDKYLKK